MRDPSLDAEVTRLYKDLLPRVSDYVDKWAQERPHEPAIIEYNTGEVVTWKKFALSTKAFAAKLLAMGLRKGDIVATMLPLLKEHVYLMYACYRIGVIIAPLDLRLKAHEVNRAFEMMHPQAFFFLGQTPVADFRPLVQEVMKAHPECQAWVQFQAEPDLILAGAQGIGAFAADVRKVAIKAILTGKIKEAMAAVGKRDPCLIIFTTGSTGEPKPALICHENIMIQNIGLGVAFDISAKDRMLVNLPPSHVGCVTEQLGTPLFMGGTVVILHIFKADESLDAIQKYKVTAFGQIPALFAMEWRLPNYAEYDLSSLKFALYGGQAVTRQFLEQLAKMAPKFGTGDGLTETAGFVTYTPLDGTVDDILASVGYDSPLCPLSIRGPMKEDGTAGDEKRAGEIGDISFYGPQIFLGYLNDPENTAKTISRDGWCYTGDLGFYDSKGLHFVGRSKLVIKPKGYQVYPTEIEDFLVQHLKDKVNAMALVGAKHEVFTEAIIAFVEAKPGVKVTAKDVDQAAQDMAAYKRPSHVVILPPGEMPLNRVAKTDYVELKKRAEQIVMELPDQGGWDAK